MKEEVGSLKRFQETNIVFNRLRAGYTFSYGYLVNRVCHFCVLSVTSVLSVKYVLMKCPSARDKRKYLEQT